MHDEQEYIVVGYRKPHKISSSGRVFVKLRGTDENDFEHSYFPHVFGLEIVDYD